MSTFDPDLSNDTTEAEVSDTQPETRNPHPLSEIVQFAIIALIIVIPIRMFIAQPFIVSGASMEDTFHGSEYLIVDQVSYYLDDPARGDVVIFRYPKDPSKFFIKRIIGVPGDTVDITGSIVTITNASGTEAVLDEPYVKDMAPTTQLSETLGDREYFVMGDNRDQSSDSRVWGVLQREKIVGRALVRLFPFKAIDWLPGEHPITINNE